MLSYAEVLALYRPLSVFDRTRKHLGLKRRIVVDFERPVNALQPLPAETFREVVFERYEEERRPGVSLTSATTSQLIVDTAGFVPFGTDDVKTAESDDLFLFGIGNFFVFFEVFAIFVSDFFLLFGYILNIRSRNVYHVVGIAVVAEVLYSHEFGVTAEQYIRSAPRHVGGYRNRAFLTRLSDNFRLALMVLCVKYVVFDLVFDQPAGNLFRFLYRNRTY